MDFKGFKIVVSRSKLSDYLLSTSHLVGRSKAKFFQGIGFDEGSVDLLVGIFTEICRSGEVIKRDISPYGVKYVIEGALDTPIGKQIKIRTVWIQLKDKTMQFVTAYPAKGRTIE